MKEICIVIPCFNEEKRLKTNIFLDFLTNNSSVFFCFVNDGSSDGTLALLQSLERNHYPGRTMVYDMKKNAGKSEAVRMGILHVSGLKRFDAIGFWDADLSTPLSEIHHLLGYLDSGENLKVAIGSRIKRMGSQIERRLMRHIMGRIFTTFSDSILKIPVYDSQCGAKIFKEDIIEVVFAKPFITEWVFDVEIIARIRNHFGMNDTLKMIVEAPLLSWEDVSGSKLNITDYFKVPIDLMRIHLHYNKPGKPGNSAR